MTREEMESTAWRLLECAKAAIDKERRRVLMQEAFELVRRAGLIREPASWQTQHRPPSAGYQLRLSNGLGATLWIDLRAQGRIDAIWAAYALAIACSDEYDEFDLWCGVDRVAGASMPWSLPKSVDQIAEATQREVLEREELLQQSHPRLAHSRKLAEEAALLRSRLIPHNAVEAPVHSEEAAGPPSAPLAAARHARRDRGRRRLPAAG